MDNSGEKKKRGRKPKIKEEKIPKKRGRKPKNTYGLTNEVPITKDLGSIVLHLPINSDDLKNDFVDKEILKYSPEIKSPKPYDKTMSIQPYSTLISSPYPFTGYHKNENILDKNTDDIVISDYKEHQTNSNSETNNEVSDESVLDKENINDFFKKKNIDSYDLLSSNTSKVYNCDNSNIDVLCHWCIHPFKNKPIGIPIKYRNNKFDTVGVFCSPECACAYNFDSNNIFDDKWYRYTLLNLMCCQLYNSNNIIIKSACSRYILNIFGGPLTIEKFRENNINYSMDYHILEPPLISLMCQINEISISPKFNNFIPIDKERIKTANDGLKLRRNKPSEKKNTLEFCMNLTYN